MSKAKPTDNRELTSEQIIGSLAAAKNTTALRAYFGAEDYEELRALAKRASKARVNGKPRVYILPGIMGSVLGRKDKSGNHTIWLNPTAIEAGKLLSLALPDAKPLQALDVMLPAYLKLKLHLMIAGFDAVFHPFDWRKSVAISGKALLQRIASDRKKSVAIVAHSMGGLVARAALADDRSKRIEKVVQLGSPNFGSFAAVQALRAVYGSVRKVASLDPLHTPEQLSRHVFRSLPGIYEILPTAARASDSDLLALESWPEDLLGPDATMLAHARRVRERLAAGRSGCYHIVGVGKETVTAVVKKRGGFEYEYTYDGDGTVPASRAEWPGAEHFFVEEVHGNLTKNDLVAAAVVDLLKNGRTKRVAAEWRSANRQIVRRASDTLLRRNVRGKVRWDQLSFAERRKILEPAISPDFPGVFARK